MAKVNHNGVDIDTELDYSAEMKKAEEAGDYEYAAYLEKSRNAKIDYLGLDYKKTNKYQNMNKNSGSGSKNGKAGNVTVPSGYNSAYMNQINALLKDINSSQFSYNPEEDEVFKMYKERADVASKKAVEDVLASQGSMTGGVPSSYAVSAATSAATDYADNVNAKAAELYKLAYDQHINELSNKYKQLSVLSSLENNEYAKYNDNLDRERQNEKDAWDEAVALAEFGDYSGLENLGVDTSNIVSKKALQEAVYNYELTGDASYLEAVGLDVSKIKEQEAKGDAEWKAQYGDTSGLEALGVDVPKNEQQNVIYVEKQPEEPYVNNKKFPEIEVRYGNTVLTPRQWDEAKEKYGASDADLSNDGYKMYDMNEIFDMFQTRILTKEQWDAIIAKGQLTKEDLEYSGYYYYD